MNSEIKESYTKDGKKLNELIQEWINENNLITCCNINKKVLENYRR